MTILERMISFRGNFSEYIEEQNGWIFLAIKETDFWEFYAQIYFSSWSTNNRQIWII